MQALDHDGTELVVASRYVAGGSTDPNWSWYRRWNSRVATWMARPFTSLCDPLAGFFALPRDVFLRAAQCDPVGYKVGLEILVKANCRQVREVPIHFVDRKRGESKLDWRQQVAYLRHLARLADYRFPRRWRLVKYCLVGLCGAMADLSVFAFALRNGTEMATARAVGIATGMTCNFIGNDRFTFGTSQLPGAFHRYLRFVLACGVGNVISFAVALLLPTLVPRLIQLPILCAVAGILAGTLFNFTASQSWAFRRPTGTPTQSLPALGSWWRWVRRSRLSASSE
jgi:dolichol-phosphate mannosyltransferase